MTRHSLTREMLGSTSRIGQGGQGIVYSAPGFKTKFTDSMVFKEYKPDAVRAMNFDALIAMPAVVEDSMPYEDAERLVSVAAWPCAIVEKDGSPIGQVMPAIPDKFRIALNTAKGTSQANAEIQHLLNHKSILSARGIDIDDAQRYSLLREIAADLAFLHRNGICVGDISPKNLLFSLTPTVSAYFIDCDTMSVNGLSALPQVETPGWEVPQGEALATIYSDAYKLGLLALRLLIGDQEAKDPNRLPTRTPRLLRKIINDSLTNSPDKRPLPTAWTYILGHAIEEVQQRELDSGQDSDEPDDLPAPPIPVVRSRPKQKPSSIGPATLKASAPVAVSATVSSPTIHTDPDILGRNRLIGASVAAAVVLAIVLVVVMLTNSSQGESTATRRSTPTTSTFSSAVTAAPGGSWNDSSPNQSRQTRPSAITLFAPPTSYFPNGQDANGQTCADGIPLGRNDLTAARGSDATTCYFARSVGTAYAAVNPTETSIVDITAPGAVDCRDVEGAARCSGPNFVMECGIRGTDRWVTCFGGSRAVVFIF